MGNKMSEKLGVEKMKNKNKISRSPIVNAPVVYCLKM